MENILNKSYYDLYGDWCIRFETPDDGYSYFFGYYDKSPLNRANDKLLAHRVSFDGREVKDDDRAEIGYFDLATGFYVPLDETLAWNWQIGAQLQWMPPDMDNLVIYNKVVGDRFVSVVRDLKSDSVRQIDSPIYTIHPSGREALAISFERHFWCRPGYCYQNVKNEEWNRLYNRADGIWRIDLITGGVKRIIEMMRVMENSPVPDFMHAPNWLEHMLYNPEGSRFMFFHRWRSDGVDNTRCYTVGRDGSGLHMFPDTRFYSHASWKNNRELTIWSIEPRAASRRSERIRGRLRRVPGFKTAMRPINSLVSRVASHEVLDSLVPRSKLLNYRDQQASYDAIAPGVLAGNGHNTWDCDRTKILLDTYQDKECYRHLMIYDVKDEHLEYIGKFYSVYNDCGYRADLHPRFSLDNRFVVIDSAHKKRRKMMVLEAVRSQQ